jgi:homoserine/homoserine lactone efflux protein
MTWQTLAFFFATAFFISATPGPNMLLAMSLGLRFGARRAAWGGFGMCVALAVMATLSAFGLGALLSTSVVAFEAVRWAGVAYLTWLGIAAWRAPVPEAGPRDGDAAASGVGEGSAARLFLRGLLVAFSNPKALVFMAALFPQFIDAAAPLAPQLVALIAVMMVSEFGWIMAYAIGGDRLAARLTNVTAARALNRLTGGLMIGAGGLLALARRV